MDFFKGDIVSIEDTVLLDGYGKERGELIGTVKDSSDKLVMVIIKSKHGDSYAELVRKDKLTLISSVLEEDKLHGVSSLMNNQKVRRTHIGEQGAQQREEPIEEAVNPTPPRVAGGLRFEDPPIGQVERDRTVWEMYGRAGVGRNAVREVWLEDDLRAARTGTTPPEEEELQGAPFRWVTANPIATNALAADADDELDRYLNELIEEEPEEDI